MRTRYFGGKGKAALNRQQKRGKSALQAIKRGVWIAALAVLATTAYAQDTPRDSAQNAAQNTIQITVEKESSMKKVTAGRNQLGKFAPKFAELNDDVLFGEVWAREAELSPRDRSVVTVVALMSGGILDSSLKYHLTTAKNNGITREEIAEIITHAAFYVGWPKAWAVFNIAKEVWAEE